MNILKKLLLGGAGGSDKDGMYYYVRAKRTGEVIQVRLHRFNDLSMSEDEGGYYTRKLIVGQRSFDRIEAEFFFDRNRNFVSADVSGGQLVDRAEYDEYVAQHQAEA